VTPEDRLGLTPAVDEERLARTWHAISGRTAQKPQSSRWGVGAAAVALLVGGVAGGLLLARPGESGALVGRDPDVSAEAGATVAAAPGLALPELRLDDGSTVDLERQGHLEVLANDGQRFVTALDGGPARFEVTPGGPRTWTVETAFATVEVVGTGFTVDPTGDRLEVVVHHGVVLVHGERVPGRVARLEAGQSLVVTDRTPVIPAVSPPPMAMIPQPAQPPAEVVPAAPVAMPVAPALVEADRLRALGRQAAAADVLERAVQADPHGPGAGLAAFTLGRLALEHLDQPARAARAFDLVLAEGPASLVEDARARREDALRRADGASPP
jgi:transmembrane sensor